MKRIALPSIVSILIGPNVYALPNKTPEQIYKDASGTCLISANMEVSGKNAGGEQLKTNFVDWRSSCFLIKFNGENRILTAAHVVSPPDLSEINSQILMSNPRGVKNLWAEITLTKLTLYVVFKSAETGSLRKVKEDFQLPASTENFKSLGILEAITEKIDADADLAIIKLKDESAYKNLKANKLGDSDRLKIGERVYTIGHPMAHEFAFLSGDVAHFHQGKLHSLKSYSYIFTSEMIGFGNSGGPLFNQKGEVVGMAIIKFDWEPHFSVFVPSNRIKDFLKSK